MEENLRRWDQEEKALKLRHKKERESCVANAKKPRLAISMPIAKDVFGDGEDNILVKCASSVNPRPTTPMPEDKDAFGNDVPVILDNHPSSL
jgi:hypothetical protein